jgi:hypothetical protein
MSAWNSSTSRVKAASSPAAARGTRATIAGATGFRPSADLRASPVTSTGRRVGVKPPGTAVGAVRTASSTRSREMEATRAPLAIDAWRGETSPPRSPDGDRAERPQGATESFSPFTGRASPATRSLQCSRRTRLRSGHRPGHRAGTMRARGPVVSDAGGPRSVPRPVLGLDRATVCGLETGTRHLPRSPVTRPQRPPGIVLPGPERLNQLLHTLDDDSR